MRIAVYHNLPYGGAMRAMLEQISRLGADVAAIYTLSGCAGGSRMSDERVRQFDAKQYKYLDYPYGRLNPGVTVANLISMNRAGRRVARAIDSESWDVVLVHPCAVVQTPPLLKYLRTPSVYYCHEVNRSVHEALLSGGVLLPWYAPAGMLARRLIVGNELDGVRAAKVVLCNSIFIRETLLRIYGVNAAVNYLGVDTSVFHPTADSGKDHAVVSVGTLAAHKNHEFMVEAISRIPADLRPLLRIVSGRSTPQAKDALETLCRSRDVTLEVHDNITDQDLRGLYSSSKVTLYAPLLEPFGLVPLESMACGTPVVGVAEGGIRETIIDGHTGFLTRRDPDEFAEAVVRLLADPSLATRMGAAGVEHVRKNWGWDSSIGQLRATLEAVACL